MEQISSSTKGENCVALADATHDGSHGESLSRSLVPILLATLIFSSLSLWGAMTSKGFLEADSCTHYLYARFAVGELHYLVNVWGRPLVTGIYAIPAALAGRMGVRVTSLFLALLIAFVAFRVAKLLKLRHPALAFIFVLAQPLVFLHSFSELTELPFAACLSLALWSYCRRQYLTMTILAALLPLARPEGFLFLILAGLALLAHRRWWWIALIPLPLLIWDYAGWRLYGRPEYSDPLNNHLPHALRWLLWLKHEWPYAQESAYARGSIFHFVGVLPAIVGPLIFPALVVGIQRCCRMTNFRSQIANPRFLIAVIPLSILSAHSLLYALGKMASNGEPRYMLVVALFWALLAAIGAEWIFGRLNLRHPYLLAGVLSLLPVTVHFIYPVLPLKLSEDWYRVADVAKWYETSGIGRSHPRLLTSHPAFYYFLDVSPTNKGRVLEWRKETVAKAPPGTLLIWDYTYGSFNSDRNRIVTVEEILAAGWIEDADAETELETPDDFRIFKSPRSMSPAVGQSDLNSHAQSHTEAKQCEQIKRVKEAEGLDFLHSRFSIQG
ncbi:MAG TPA: hypothetical protein VF669_17750 [Tepidisphaeraceae bacterium]|jgi:hypothetical protein